MNDLNKEQKSLLMISICTSLLDILTGPFLAIYMLSNSLSNVHYIILYRLIQNVVILFAYYFISTKLKHVSYNTLLRIGFCINLVYFLCLGNGSINNVNIVLLGILSGLFDSFYWSTFNYFDATVLDNESRPLYSKWSNIIGTVFRLCLCLLTGYISFSFSFTQMIPIAIGITFVQIHSSLNLKKVKKDTIINTKGLVKNILNNLELKNILQYSFMISLTVKGGALTRLLPLVLAISVKSELVFGVVQAFQILMILSLVLVFLRKYYNASEKMQLPLSTLLFAALCSMSYLQDNNIGMILVYLSANISITCLEKFGGLNTQRYADLNVPMEHKEEWLVVREIAFDLGRILSFIIFLVLFKIFGASVVYAFIVLSGLFEVYIESNQRRKAELV